MNYTHKAICIGTINLSGKLLYLYRQRGNSDNLCEYYFGLSTYRHGPKDSPMFCTHSSIKSAILEYSHTARVSVKFFCSI